MTDAKKDSLLTAFCAAAMVVTLAIAYADWERISGAYCSEYNWCFEERK